MANFDYFCPYCDSTIVSAKHPLSDLDYGPMDRFYCRTCKRMTLFHALPIRERVDTLLQGPDTYAPALMPSNLGTHIDFIDSDPGPSTTTFSVTSPALTQ